VARLLGFGFAFTLATLRMRFGLGSARPWLKVPPPDPGHTSSSREAAMKYFDWNYEAAGPYWALMPDSSTTLRQRAISFLI